MADMSQEEKRALLKSWKQQESDMDYILNDAEVQSLFDYLEKVMNREPCDHTLRHTMAWLKKTIPEDRAKAAISEMREMGGYCDCEVLFNCYEEYLESDEME